MHDLSGSGRDLVAVERCKDVLRIAPINAIALAIQHIGIQEMRPRIDGIERAQTAASPTNRLPLAAFVSIQISLESVVPCENGCPTVSVRTTTSSRYFRPRCKMGISGRSWSGCIDRTACFDAKDVHAQGAFEEVLVGLDDARFAAQGSDACVGRRKR